MFSPARSILSGLTWAILSSRKGSPGNRCSRRSLSTIRRACSRAASRRLSSMRNGGTPDSSRLLLAASKSSFSAAESSSEDDRAAEFEWGVGCWLRTSWLASLQKLTAGGVVSAAQGPGFTAKIANETNRARSIILRLALRRGDRLRKFRFPSLTLASRIQLSYLLWRPYCWLPCSPEPLSCLGSRLFFCAAFRLPRKWMQKRKLQVSSKGSIPPLARRSVS